MVFLAKAKKGELDFGSPYNKARLKTYLQEKEGKIFRLELQVENRTGQQNRFYWNYLGIIETETGNNADDLHELFKRKLLAPQFKEVKINGEKIEFKIPATTTTLSKIDFGEYLDKISAMTGVPIPDPNQLDGYISNY